ncbi:MAG: hypothetical protein ACE5L7_11775 [Candidatus Aminicenantales bacterium]
MKNMVRKQPKACGEARSKGQFGRQEEGTRDHVGKEMSNLIQVSGEKNEEDP